MNYVRTGYGKLHNRYAGKRACTAIPCHHLETAVNGIESMVAKHPLFTEICVAAFGAWLAVTVYHMGVASADLRGTWQKAVSEQMGG